MSNEANLEQRVKDLEQRLEDEIKRSKEFDKQSAEDRELLREMLELVVEMRKSAQGQEAAVIRRMEKILRGDKNKSAGSRPEGKELQDGDT